MNAWRDFFVADVGASAALAGLLFVSLSINIERILKSPWLPPRALQSVLALMVVLLTGLITLIPGKSLEWQGANLLVLAAAGVALAIRLSVTQLTVPATYRFYAAINFAANLLFYAIAIAGSILITRGNADGLYWLATAVLYAFCYAVYNSWVLLVEILR